MRKIVKMLTFAAAAAAMPVNASMVVSPEKHEIRHIFTCEGQSGGFTVMQLFDVDNVKTRRVQLTAVRPLGAATDRAPRADEASAFADMVVIDSAAMLCPGYGIEIRYPPRDIYLQILNSDDDAETRYWYDDSFRKSAFFKLTAEGLRFEPD